MAYVDGFVLAVPTKNKDAYLKMAKTMSILFKEWGAVKIVENWGEDVPEGKVTSFPMAVKRTPDETVVLSWIVYPSKAVRDAANKKMMEDPRMKEMEMPFDGQRMIFGGFETILDV